MRLAIWKFQLQVTLKQDVEMPLGTEILCLQTQQGRPCLWAEVNPDNKTEARTFRIVGTGNSRDINSFGKYIGTFQDGMYVWHLYEIV